MDGDLARKREYMREWRKSNLERAREIDRASKEKNKAKILARKAEYRRSNAEKIRQYNAAYSANNAEKMREWRDRWALNNPHVLRAAKARRRAIETYACPAWADMEAMRAIYKECLRVTQETGITHHVDHVVPLRGELVCGLHVPSNLQVIPAIDNFVKSNKWGP